MSAEGATELASSPLYKSMWEPLGLRFHGKARRQIQVWSVVDAVWVLPRFPSLVNAPITQLLGLLLTKTHSCPLSKICSSPTGAM